MIDIKWGKPISYLDSKRRKYVLRFSGNSISCRNFLRSYTRYFLKWNKRAFAICLPCKTFEAENIKWIFGWRLHEKIDFCTDKIDPIIFELHIYKIEVALYR